MILYKVQLQVKFTANNQDKINEVLEQIEGLQKKRSDLNEKVRTPYAGWLSLGVLAIELRMRISLPVRFRVIDAGETNQKFFVKDGP